MTGSELCGDSLSFSKDLMFSPYFNSTMARYGTEEAWANNTAGGSFGWTAKDARAPDSPLERRESARAKAVPCRRSCPSLVLAKATTTVATASRP